MNFKRQHDKYLRAYQMGFEDGQATAKEAIEKAIDTLKQRLIGRQYAAIEAATAQACQDEPYRGSYLEEDLG